MLQDLKFNVNVKVHSISLVHLGTACHWQERTCVTDPPVFSVIVTGLLLEDTISSEVYQTNISIEMAEKGKGKEKKGTRASQRKKDSARITDYYTTHSSEEDNGNIRATSTRQDGDQSIHKKLDNITKMLESVVSRLDSVEQKLGSGLKNNCV